MEKSEESEELFQIPQNKLVNGINLKELKDNKDVVFEFDEGYSNMFYEDSSEIYNESNLEEIDNLEKLREARAAPQCSFEALAAEMEPLDSQGFIRKHIIKAGMGLELPEEAEVVVHYNFYKEYDEIPFDSTYMRGRPFKFRLYEAAIHGLSIAVKSMRKGENSRFLIKYQFAFGEQGIPPRIPPKCEIYADVTLIDFTTCKTIIDPNALTEDKHTKKTFEELLKEADDLRYQGNKFYGSQNFTKAIVFYRNATNIMNRMHLANEEEEKIMFQSKNKALVNLAMCYNEVRKPESACLALQEVLKREPNYTKATVQLAIAKYYLGNYDTAGRLLKKAQKIVPNSELINQYLKKVNDKLEISKLVEKDFCRKAFST